MPCPNLRMRPVQSFPLYMGVLSVCLWASAAEAASVTLAWNANPEPDIAGYVIEYGNLPGVRTSGQIAVGNVTTFQVNGLTDGLPYYFSIRAVNTSGVQSGPSIEVSKRVGIPNTAFADFDGDRHAEVGIYRP